MCALGLDERLYNTVSMNLKLAIQERLAAAAAAVSALPAPYHHTITILFHFSGCAVAWLAAPRQEPALALSTIV